jgi:AcrR family transcriptional regulator
MAFGKLGRPADDRLARQREIYEAVAPLILDKGVRYLSMRVAARAACLSVGGLYHHFPTKRALVLYGLQPETINRHCQDFHDKFDYLAASYPDAYLDAGLASMTDSLLFIRPAFHAALELGIETFKDVLEASLTTATHEFSAAIRLAFPDAAENDVSQAARAFSRAMIAGLLDKNMTAHEFRAEVAALINGYLVRQKATSNIDTT